MSDKKELSAKDLIIGLMAEMDTEKVAEVIASAKKGLECLYRNRQEPSWKPAELKKLRSQMLFGRWNWSFEGIMFRSSWDGYITQEVVFFHPHPMDFEVRVNGSAKTRRAFDMLAKLAEEAVRNCDGETRINVILTDDQVCSFYAEGGDDE